MDEIKPKIKGYIIITNIETKEILLQENNTLSVTALEVLLKSLTNLNQSPSVDIIRGIGTNTDTTAFSIDKTIATAVYSSGDNSLNFEAIFDNGDFNGNLTEARLRSSILDLDFSYKTGLNILKDNLNQLSIAWKIILT